MKRVWILILVCLLVLPLAACGGEETPPVSTQPLTEEETENYPDYEFDLTPYVRLPDHSALPAYFEDPTVCTDEEVEEWIFQVMLTYATFVPESEDRPIELYDRVSIAYYGYVDGEVVDDLVDTDTAVVVGQKSDTILQVVLGDAILGARVGDTVETDYTYPKDAYFAGLAGKTVHFEVKIYTVEYAVVPPCDDRFVQENYGETYGLETVEDFRVQVRNDILEDKEEKKITAVWDAFVDGVEILGYPEGPMQWYRDAYDEDCLSTAKEYGVSMEKYLKDFLQLTREAYEEQREIYAQRCVASDMELMQLARESGVTLTDEEFRTGVEQYLADSGEDRTFEEFVKEHGEHALRTNLIWDKALQQLVENAVRLERISQALTGEPETGEPETGIAAGD